MDAPYSPLEFSLLNDWQRGFPLDPQPFARLGEKLGAGEAAVVETLRRLHRRGAISRIGAVFAPMRLGAGTLAALAAPPERLEAVAAQVSARPEVNHNYQREHHWNLWFVLTTRDQAALAASLRDIETDTGCPVLAMPLRREYHIDLGFDLGERRQQDHRGHRGPPAAMADVSARSLSEEERRLCEALEPGLLLTEHPYAELACRSGLSEREVLDYLACWQDEGLIKRFGIVVRHHEMGFRANAMVVFDLPDEHVDAIGEQLAAEAAVTLCYRRERCPPEWPYNLYCMVHGRSRDEVAPVVERLAATASAAPTVLFSVRRFKQCGARYFSGGIR